MKAEREREWIMIRPTLAATTLLESVADDRNEMESGGREGRQRGRKREK